jgi:3-dehydroquinate synthase
MTSSAGLFNRLTQADRHLHARAAGLTPVIAESCRIKADVVSADERESGVRRILNFGHRPATPSKPNDQHGRFRHGEAVALDARRRRTVSGARGPRRS